MCGCPSSKLCPLCLDGRFAQLRGVAACRGEAWASAVALRARAIAQWPTTEKMFAIARRKVEDLAIDPRLLELLVGELVAWAARRWTASTSSFTEQTDRPGCV